MTATEGYLQNKKKRSSTPCKQYCSLLFDSVAPNRIMQEEAACDGEEGRLPWFTSLTGTIRRARSVGYYSTQTKWKACLSFIAMQPWGEQVEVWLKRDTLCFRRGSLWTATMPIAFIFCMTQSSIFGSGSFFLVCHPDDGLPTLTEDILWLQKAACSLLYECVMCHCHAVLCTTTGGMIHNLTLWRTAFSVSLYRCQ